MNDRTYVSHTWIKRGGSMNGQNGHFLHRFWKVSILCFSMGVLKVGAKSGRFGHFVVWLDC